MFFKTKNDNKKAFEIININGQAVSEKSNRKYVKTLFRLTKTLEMRRPYMYLQRAFCSTQGGLENKK